VDESGNCHSYQEQVYKLEELMIYNNYKTFSGIQHFFNFGDDDEHRGEFLENVDSDALGNNTVNNF
jgi:hypothetical protein